MFAGIIFTLSFFQYESPRFLVKNGRSEEAAAVMAHLRQQSPESDYVVEQISTIQAALDREVEASRGVGWLGKIKELFLIPSNLYRIYLAIMCQILSQWSGAGSITVYAPDLFSLLGVKGTTESLLATAVFGSVKLVSSTMCALFLVDIIGRKRSLLIGITLQAIAMIYIASFLTSVPSLGVVDGFELPNKDKPASLAAITMIYISGVGWALGWNSMQYVLLCLSSWSL